MCGECKVNTSGCADPVAAYFGEHPGNATELCCDGARVSGKREEEEDEAPTAEIISG